jgi:succinate dehydrogenase / fumarate reductase cytochrome b subunit
LHRITGLGLLFYFLLHILVTSSRVFGAEAWNNLVNGTLAAPLFKIGEFFVYAAFAFHGLNGLRLVLIEFGFAVGKAEEPVYPYRSSVNVQRPLWILVMILAFVVAVLGGYDLFAYGH